MIKKTKIHVFKVVSIIGLLLHIPAVIAFFSIFIALIFKEYFALETLIFGFLVYLSLGQFFYRSFSKQKRTNIWDSMIIAALGWFLCSVAASFLYFFISRSSPDFYLGNAVFKSYINSLFESFSGFTSTGLTMVDRPEELSYVLQWIRSMQSWIGGIGLIVFVISIIEPKREEYSLYFAEGRSEQIGKNITQTTQKIWKIYFSYTIVIGFLFFLSDMPLWDSVNHAMTSIATGGFSVSNVSFEKYSISSKIIAIFAMVIGCTSFCLHYRLIVNRSFSKFFKSKQHLMLFFLLISGSLILIFLDRVLKMDLGYLSSTFQWFSALSTCGFRVVNVKELLPFVKLFLIFAMIIGGSSGSTSGGIKIRRFINLFSGFFLRITKESGKEIVKDIKESAVSEREVTDVEFPKSEKTFRLYSSTILFSLWIIFILISWFLVLILTEGNRPLNVLFDITSAIGNVGMSTGVVSPSLSIFPKIIFIFLMWLGRLEIIPIFILFISILTKKKV